MSKGVKVVLVVVGVCSLLFAAGVVGVVVWVKKNVGTWTEMGRQAVAEGRQYGHGRPSEECVGEAMGRLKNHLSFSQELANKFFLQACLEAADQPAGYCDDVPPPTEIVNSVKFSLSRCRAYPGVDKQSCGRLVRSIQDHCHGPPIRM